jgi:hypothetical protein
MTPITHELLELVEKLDEHQQQQVLNYVRQLTAPARRYYTALELLELPAEEREHYVEASFKSSQHEDFEIFEAYSEDDLE